MEHLETTWSIIVASQDDGSADPFGYVTYLKLTMQQM